MHPRKIGLTLERCIIQKETPKKPRTQSAKQCTQKVDITKKIAEHPTVRTKRTRQKGTKQKTIEKREPAAQGKTMGGKNVGGKTRDTKGMRR